MVSPKIRTQSFLQAERDDETIKYFAIVAHFLYPYKKGLKFLIPCPKGETRSIHTPLQDCKFSKIFNKFESFTNYPFRLKFPAAHLNLPIISSILIIKINAYPAIFGWYIKKPLLSQQGFRKHQWWCGPGSNRRHKDFQSFALPTELPHHSVLGVQK